MQTQYDEMWLVTRPTKDSEIVDIVVHIGTWRDLKFQFDGGLDPDDILYAFDNEADAGLFARAILGHRCDVCGEIPAVMYAELNHSGGGEYVFLCEECQTPRGFDTPVYLAGIVDDL